MSCTRSISPFSSLPTAESAAAFPSARERPKAQGTQAGGGSGYSLRPPAHVGSLFGLSHYIAIASQYNIDDNN